MAVNAFVLARYDALNKANPDFMWTQLGIFAANTVRIGLAESYTVADAMNTVASQPNELRLGRESDDGGRALAAGLGETVRTMANETLKGQLGVLKDVGSLALMHKIYGAESLSSATFEGMTPAARKSFELQADAERYRDRGDMEGFYIRQTRAAIEMGRHEQANLQKMWDQPVMTTFAKTNEFMRRYFGMPVVRPDIYIGVNPAADRGNGISIPMPDGAGDLTKLENRVAIAANGFRTINGMRQKPAGDAFIEYYQDRLGHSKGLVQPVLRRSVGI